MSCPDCFSGAIHEGQPRGSLTKAYGLDVYVVEPSNGQPAKGIIVVISDAFGWEFVNARLIADNYADKGGFKVYVPDFMKGRSTPLWVLERVKESSTATNVLSKIYHLLHALYGIIPFMIHNYPSKAYQVVKGFFEQLRKEEGATLSVGAVGFCWGGKQTLLLARGDTIDGKPLIDAAFTGHPSLLSLPGDAEKLNIPTSFAIGDQDSYVSVAQAEKIKAIVERKPDAARGEARIYQNAGHGFCVRADVTLANSAKQAVEAENQCISWFNSRFEITS